jgi:uncharacterized damage-inducible protein DinB
MIDKTYLTTMAKYNSWQNRSLYAAAATLSDDARRQERGAFFGSIHTTLNHLLWADRTWLARFIGGPLFGVSSKDGLSLYKDFDELKHERDVTDTVIEDWTRDLDPQWLEGDLFWFSGILNRDVSMSKQHLVTHFFNHETHHRGQVHAMLTMAGAKPEDTDLMLLKV